MEKYKVRFYQDDLYRVMEPAYGDCYEYGEGEEPVFTGSLSDCEAYIRLHEQGYM